MRNSNTTDWATLLATQKSQRTLRNFAVGKSTVRDVTSTFAHSPYAGEFRKLVRDNGAVYARRLTRKALRYRGLLTPTTV